MSNRFLLGVGGGNVPVYKLFWYDKSILDHFIAILYVVHWTLREFIKKKGSLFISIISLRLVDFFWIESVGSVGLSLSQKCEY